MTNTASTTTSPPTRPREQWVDQLRVVLIAGVVVVHTATAYVTDLAGFYYDDERVVNTLASMVLAVPALMGARTAPSWSTSPPPSSR